MRKILLLVIAIILFSISAYGQTVEVSKIKEADSLKSAVQKQAARNIYDSLKSHAMQDSSPYARYFAPRTSDPSTAREGQVYANTTSHVPKYYNGSSWLTIQTTAPGSSIPASVQGDILYASAANTLSALAKSTSATRYLSNTGTSNNPAWAQVDLSNGVTGALPNGNLASGIDAAKIANASVSNTEFQYLDGVTSAIQTQIDGKQSTITFGTGVQTALGVNIGSAGAPVLFNGAGGTPSSLTLTSATGLPATGGGTGQSTYTKGDLLASPGSNTLNKLGVGTDGQVLTADAASTNGVKWAAAGGGSSTWLIKTTTYTAVVGDLIQADTSGAAWTLTLPASASVGNVILVEDATLSWATNNLTLNRNGLKINGGTSNYTANVVGGKLSLVYISAGYGWSVK